MHQLRPLLAVEEAGHLTRGQEGVHILEEVRVHNVRLIKNEANLLTLRAAPLHHKAEVLFKVLDGIGTMDLNLEDRQVIHPRDEAREDSLADAGGADEQHVTEGLAEDAVNADDVVDDGVKDNKLDIHLLIGEGLKLLADVRAEILSGGGGVGARQHRREENGALEAAAVDRREAVGEAAVHRLVRPLLLLLVGEAIAE